MIVVDHFGLHTTEGGVPLLVQEGRVDHTLNIPLDVRVKVQKPNRNLRCPHNINLEEGKVFRLIGNNPIVELMLPAPKPQGEKALFLEDTEANRGLVGELFRLSSAKGAVMLPFWTLKGNIIHQHLRLTNITPLVLFGVPSDHMAKLRRIVDAAPFMPRRLILMLPGQLLRPSQLIPPSKLCLEDIKPLPLEQMGAGWLRHKMQQWKG